jgi:hypothetical protein
MLDQIIIDKLRERYPNVHPLLFHRSVEKARSNGELFDIMDTVPDQYPLVWSEKDYRWVVSQDLFLSEEFFGQQS